jgi:L-glyceraldehyde 3-phosphate reductase
MKTHLLKKKSMVYTANEKRYTGMKYRRCGKSGLKLPSISLGLWQNFSDFDLFDNCRLLLREAFDNGITHFDLANNYGPPPGSAEETFGRVMKKDFKPYRDEMIISTKAGYDMWPGPYGDFGSKKYLVASLNQSLKRLGLDYVDIFYHHRPDPQTPVEETMLALDLIVRQGKALYVGISNYSDEQSEAAIKVLKELKTPFIIHQAKYSMLERWVENGLLKVLDHNGAGCIAFSPLAQGMLTDKYLNGIPEGSRASREHTSLNPGQVSSTNIEKARKLNEIALTRGQSLAQMAIAWLLKDERITSVLIGASKVSQLQNSLESLRKLDFSTDELSRIEEILK